MSHFFTKAKSDQLATLNDHITGLDSAAPGQVLKAVEVGGEIKFQPGEDSVGGGSDLPAGAASGDFISYRADQNSWGLARQNVYRTLNETSPYRALGDVLTVMDAESTSLGVVQNDDSNNPSAPLIFSIGFDTVAAWQSHARDVEIRFRVDPGLGGVDVTVDNTSDKTIVTTSARFDGSETIAVLKAAFDALAPAGMTLDVVDLPDTTAVTSADIGGGINWSGEVSGENVIYGFGSTIWMYQQPAPTKMLTNAEGIRFVLEGELTAGGTYDLHLVGNEVIVVLEDWSSLVGEVTLRLRHGLVGQQVFIKNLSQAEQYDPGTGAPNRVIKVLAGEGSAGSGMIDLESGISFVVDPMVDMHLVCINGDGSSVSDGDWIIL